MSEVIRVPFQYEFTSSVTGMCRLILTGGVHQVGYKRNNEEPIALDNSRNIAVKIGDKIELEVYYSRSNPFNPDGSFLEFYDTKPFGGSHESPKPVKEYQLTKREQFAMAAMQGLLARGSHTPDMEYCRFIVNMTVQIADDLIKELEK